jgi:antitoxin ParD1/3/4
MASGKTIEQGGGCMTEEAEQDWRTAAERESDIAQARALREQARKGGLRFEVYLPSNLAEWLLDLVEEGVFTDPGEAVFVILGEHKDLEPHADLREEILRRTLQAAMDDPHPGFTAEEVNERMRKSMSEPRAEPAVWRQRKDR